MKERIIFKVKKILEAFRKGELSWDRASYMISILADRLFEQGQEDLYYKLAYLAGAPVENLTDAENVLR